MTYGERRMNSNGRKSMNPKKQMIEKLVEHSKEQTPKHIALMNNLIKSGDSFQEAHKKALKSVGK